MSICEIIHFSRLPWDFGIQHCGGRQRIKLARTFQELNLLIKLMFLNNFWLVLIQKNKHI
jgi:hypothetical protein